MRRTRSPPRYNRPDHGPTSALRNDPSTKTSHMKCRSPQAFCTGCSGEVSRRVGIPTTTPNNENVPHKCADVQTHFSPIASQRPNPTKPNQRETILNECAGARTHFAQSALAKCCASRPGTPTTSRLCEAGGRPRRGRRARVSWMGVRRNTWPRCLGVCARVRKAVLPPLQL